MQSPHHPRRMPYSIHPPNVINNGFHCNFMQLTITHMDLIIVCSIRSLLFSSNVGDRVTTSCNLLCVWHRFLYHIDIIIGVGVLRHRLDSMCILTGVRYSATVHHLFRLYTPGDSSFVLLNVPSAAF